MNKYASRYVDDIPFKTIKIIFKSLIIFMFANKGNAIVVLC